MEGLYLFDPECQPELSFRPGDLVELHGFTNVQRIFHLTHFEFTGAQP